MEVKQMCGRAGRPGYDPYGEAVLIAKNDRDFDHLMEDYVEHDTERLTSKLFNDKVLRSHILGLVATGDADSEDSIIDFLRETFFGTTSQLFGIESVVERVVDFLENKGMVERVGDSIHILPFGKRVSDLYIDPASASIMKDAVLRIRDDTDPMQILICAAMTPDVLGMYPKKSDTDRIRDAEVAYSEGLLVDPDDIEDYYAEFFQSDLKTALLIHDWISEVPEDIMTESLGIGPGDIRSRVDMMDWIIYSMNEIALIFNTDATTVIKPLKTRIRYGVLEELVGLVNLRGVGRSRARILYSSGIRGVDDIIATDETALASIPKIGPALARSLKDQVGGRSEEMHIARMSPSEEEAMLDEMAAAYGEPDMVTPVQEPAVNEKKAVQKSLFDF
jgi:helicase